MAGLRFEKRGEVQQTIGMGLLAWNLVREADGVVVGTGIDVALIDGGVISALWTLLGGPSD